MRTALLVGLQVLALAAVIGGTALLCWPAAVIVGGALVFVVAERAT